MLFCKTLFASLPLQKGGIPLFGKEGLGEIFGRKCLLNYGLLSNEQTLSKDIENFPSISSPLSTFFSALPVSIFPEIDSE
ncbi:MAG: hypothetical protein A2157_07060 [Deltaproteobacteria bacterium RBG_16_47_11]|nr:MAG: hypothetical protein A2157_07060 [Deltaproteobacteria bacterium RBG_16_47_11]